MTRRADRWDVYSVDDSTGIRLSVRNAGGAELAAFVFGQSRRDWSKNYVRLASEDAVYLTDNNITYYLNATPDFWGRKPEPAAADSTGPDIDVGAAAPSVIPPAAPGSDRCEARYVGPAEAGSGRRGGHRKNERVNAQASDPLPSAVLPEGISLRFGAGIRFSRFFSCPEFRLRWPPQDIIFRVEGARRARPNNGGRPT